MKTIFEIGDKVKVIYGGNASSFNPTHIPIRGVYSIKNWENEIFTVGGEYEETPMSDELWGAYPLLLGGKLVGYVYNSYLQFVDSSCIFKSGDFVVSKEENPKISFIFKEFKDFEIKSYIEYNDNTNSFSKESSILLGPSFRMMTTSEISSFLQLMLKENLRWDAKAKKIVNSKFKPVVGNLYYTPSFTNSNLYTTCVYSNSPKDKRLKKLGLIYPNEKKAIEVAKKMLKFK